ncbi:MAG: hypothetical protein ACE5H4_04650 [Candidatus Thorarchaeota archaeon]
MSYRHKKSSCSKKTREILEDFEPPEEDKYGPVQVTEAVNDLASRKESDTAKEKETNVLPPDAEERLRSDDERQVQIPPMPTNEIEPLEDYVPIQEASFEVEATKEDIEKKRKKRNYVEFRADYG